MAKIDDLRDRSNETIYPRTLTRAVYDLDTGEKLDSIMDKKMDKTKITISNAEADVSLMNENDIWIKYE